jgi:hypothetical protein
MKKLLFVLILFGAFSVTNAQFLNYGIKGGINYNSNGDLRSLEGFDLLKISSDEEAGFHIGFFSEIKLPFFLYLRPELVYTHTESSYQGENESTKLKKDIIEAPVLIGFRVFKIGRIFLGPSFQYAISTDLKETPSFDNIKNISSDDFTVAGQVGIGINLGKIGADIRWESGFSDSEALFIGDVIGEDNSSSLLVDTSQQQFILSFYYKFK